MADLTITAANVVPGTGARIDRTGFAGATITAGQVVAKAADGTWSLADDNSATAGIRDAKGVALNGASDGQPLAVATQGPVTIGATLTAGVAYYLSDTPGGIAPVADLASGEYTVLVGLAKSASVLDVDIQNSGAAIA